MVFRSFMAALLVFMVAGCDSNGSSSGSISSALRSVSVTPPPVPDPVPTPDPAPLPGPDPTPDPAPDPTPSPDPAPDGSGGLQGEPDALALAAVVDVEFPEPVPGRISSTGVALTRLGVLFAPDSSVGEVNAALEALEARIAYARRGSLLMVLEVPPQPDAGRMLELAGELRAQPGVVTAWTERVAAPKVLPRRADGRPAEAADLAHLLPTRFPAAWNAAGLLEGCETRPVRVIVVDYFDPAIPAPFFTLFPAGSLLVDDIEREAHPDGDHGYLVTLAMAGNHDGETPTGTHPRASCLVVEQLDVPSRPGSEKLDALKSRLEDIDDKVVVQLSIGDSTDLCGPDGDDECESDFAELTQQRLQDALRGRIGTHLHWARSGLTPSNVENALFTVAAGNEANDPLGAAYAGFRDARLSLFPQGVAQLPIVRAIYGNESFGIDLWSPLTSTGEPRAGLPSAHLPPDELDGFQQAFDALDKDALVAVRNVLTVGATGTQPFDTFPADGRGLPLARFSNENAMVHAVGVDLRLGLPSSSTGVDSHEGTSYAAPQVAGLAAYLWLLSDELRAQPAQATRQHLLATAQRYTVNGVEDRSNEAGINDIIDAYAAVLALDRPGEPKRVRLAILDVNGDGRFTQADIELFLAAFAEFDRGDAERAPDFSRFDLNGDGFTGGGLVAPMDLDAELYDASGRPVLEEILLVVDGVPRSFDERFVTDLDALCFFAYDATLVPYTGSLQRRTELLEPERCAPISISVVFPQAFSGDADLDLLLTRLVSDAAGGTTAEPVPGLTLRLTATCANLSSDRVVTGEDGRARVNVVAQAGCTSVDITIEVLGEDDVVTRTTTVSANVLREGPPLNELGFYRGTYSCQVQNDIDISLGRERNCNSLTNDRIRIGFGRNDFACFERGECDFNYIVVPESRALTCEDPVMVFPRATDTFTQERLFVTFSITRSLRGFTPRGDTRLETMTGFLNRSQEPVLLTLTVEAEERRTSGELVARFSCLFEGENVGPR